MNVLRFADLVAAGRVTGQRVFIRADLNVAWPNAEIAVMGAEGAAKIVFRREIASAKDPKQEEQRLVAEYKAKFNNPYMAAARGYVDDIIEPRRTRPVLIQALELLASKRDRNPPKKHGNIPL
jgi:propionyl-CoA carboxylase beta chain